MTKYVVFTVFVIAAFVYGWFTVSQQQSLLLIINNESAQNYMVDVVGDGCETPCLQMDNELQKIASQANFSSLINLNSQGELRLIIHSANLSLDHLLVRDVAQLSSNKLMITVNENHQIDIHFD